MCEVGDGVRARPGLHARDDGVLVPNEIEEMATSDHQKQPAALMQLATAAAPRARLPGPASKLL